MDGFPDERASLQRRGSGPRVWAEGLDGLANRRVAQRPWRLTPEQMTTLATWVEAGPDAEKDGVVRWRRFDLQARIAAESGVTLHERTVGKQLAALGFRRLQVASAAPEVQPRNPDGVQKNFPEAVAAAIPEAARDMPLEIWFQGEPGQKTVRGTVFPANARVGQQGTLTCVWAKRGTRPKAKRDTRYQWSCIFGAVCPGRATAAGLVLPFANSAAMNLHPAEIARTVAERAHAILVLDGAGWHGSAALTVPDNISLLHLPPYAPELNPVENVWACLRANKLAITVFDS